MELVEILREISIGQFDHDLNPISDAVQRRKKVLGQRRFSALSVGDTVVFNDSVGRGLAGKSAVVADKKRTNLVVVTDDGTRWTANPGLLELV